MDKEQQKYWLNLFMENYKDEIMDFTHLDVVFYDNDTIKFTATKETGTIIKYTLDTKTGTMETIFSKE